jgi:hypothetical protein
VLVPDALADDDGDVEGDDDADGDAAACWSFAATTALAWLVSSEVRDERVRFIWTRAKIDIVTEVCGVMWYCRYMRFAIGLFRLDRYQGGRMKYKFISLEGFVGVYAASFGSVGAMKSVDGTEME